MAESTEIVCTANFVYLVDLIDASRLANSQVPLPQTSAFKIEYFSKVGNTTAIEFSTEPDIVSKFILPEASFEESYDHEVSLRNWYVRGLDQHLIVTLQS